MYRVFDFLFPADNPLPENIAYVLTGQVPWFWPGIVFSRFGQGCSHLAYFV